MSRLQYTYVYTVLRFFDTDQNNYWISVSFLGTTKAYKKESNDKAL